VWATVGTLAVVGGGNSRRWRRSAVVGRGEGGGRRRQGRGSWSRRRTAGAAATVVGGGGGGGSGGDEGGVQQLRGRKRRRRQPSAGAVARAVGWGGDGGGWSSVRTLCPRRLCCAGCGWPWGRSGHQGCPWVLTRVGGPAQFNTWPQVRPSGDRARGGGPAPPPVPARALRSSCFTSVGAIAPRVRRARKRIRPRATAPEIRDTLKRSRARGQTDTRPSSSARYHTLIRRWLLKQRYDKSGNLRTR